MRFTLIMVFLMFSFGKSFSQINNDFLKIGENAPRITGVDQFNSTIDSDEILKENKVLLMFYRGNWCPYCNKHLLSLQENLEALTKEGVYVIVVTPEKVDKILESTKNFNATFSIIHDADNKIMNDYKVAFEVNKQNVPKYFIATQKKIEEYNEINNNTLPVPATYIIDNDKKIEYVHYDPDYSNRANIVEILNSFK